MTREEGKYTRPCCTACVASAVASALPPALGGLEGLRPLPSAFYHVLSPPSTAKIETARPWVVSLSWRIVPGLRVFPAPEAPRHTDVRWREVDPDAIVSGSIFAGRWSLQRQAVNMSDPCSFRGPATEDGGHPCKNLRFCPPRKRESEPTTGC